MTATPELTVAEISWPATLPAPDDSYVVQQGNSLSSIAARPEIYDNATQWQRIFTANRDQLGSPDDLQPGMTLRIPRDGESEPVQEGTTFFK